MDPTSRHQNIGDHGPLSDPWPFRVVRVTTEIPGVQWETTPLLHLVVVYRHRNSAPQLYFPFRNDVAHCALGNFQHSRNCFIPFPRSMPPHNSISDFYREFLGLLGGVSTLTCTVNCGTLHRKVCFFQNHIQSIELVKGGLQTSWRHLKDNQRKLDTPDLNLQCHNKGVEYLLTQDISAFHF